MNARQRYVLTILFGALSPVSAQLLAAPIQWTGSGSTRHYYELVLDSGNWTQARDDAAARSFLGVAGHLVTITSAAENSFLASTFDAAHDNFAWIGASDLAVEGEWRWVVGPEAGIQFSQVQTPTLPYNYANWGPVEPNNAGNEDAAALNLGGISGGGTLFAQWGDTDIVTTSLAAYIVEYSGTFAEIPEPGTHAILLAGLALIGFEARRRRVRRRS